MADIDAAVATQLRNIQQSTGRSVEDWAAVVAAAGPSKHGEIVSYLKGSHGLTHGNANLLAHRIRELAEGGAASAEDVLDAQYSGAKQGLRPIYEEVVAHARDLGADVEIVVQKTGVSLRRSKQFALVRAPSAKRVELGLNLDDKPNGRLEESTGMCSRRVLLTDPADVDQDVIGWLRSAYDRAR